MMDFKGKINGIVVDVQISIEDVESTAILDFPQKIFKHPVQKFLL